MKGPSDLSAAVMHQMQSIYRQLQACWDTQLYSIKLKLWCLGNKMFVVIFSELFYFAGTLWASWQFCISASCCETNITSLLKSCFNSCSIRLKPFAKQANERPFVRITTMSWEQQGWWPTLRESTSTGCFLPQSHSGEIWHVKAEIIIISSMSRYRIINFCTWDGDTVVMQTLR